MVGATFSTGEAIFLFLAAVGKIVVVSKLVGMITNDCSVWLRRVISTLFFVAIWFSYFVIVIMLGELAETGQWTTPEVFTAWWNFLGLWSVTLSLALGTWVGARRRARKVRSRQSKSTSEVEA